MFQEFLLRCCHLLWFYVFPSKICQLLSQIVSSWALNVFECLYCISLHERMDVVDAVPFSPLILDFEARLEKISKQLKLRRFPFERGHRCRERFWQFGFSVHLGMEVCRIVVICQLLKRQQKIGLLQSSQEYSHCEIAVDWLNGFFLLSWSCTRGAVIDFFVDSCHQVVAIANVFCNSCHHVVAIF